MRGRRRPRGMRAAEGREQQAKGVGVPRPGRRGGGFRCSWQSRRLERHLQEPFAEMREAGEPMRRRFWGRQAPADTSGLRDKYRLKNCL